MNITDFPTEISFIIFGFLNEKDLNSLKMVNKLFCSQVVGYTNHLADMKAAKWEKNFRKEKPEITKIEFGEDPPYALVQLENGTIATAHSDAIQGKLIEPRRRFKIWGGSQNLTVALKCEEPVSPTSIPEDRTGIGKLVGSDRYLLERTFVRHGSPCFVLMTFQEGKSVLKSQALMWFGKQLRSTVVPVVFSTEKSVFLRVMDPMGPAEKKRISLGKKGKAFPAPLSWMKR